MQAGRGRTWQKSRAAGVNVYQCLQARAVDRQLDQGVICHLWKGEAWLKHCSHMSRDSWEAQFPVLGGMFCMFTSGLKSCKSPFLLSLCLSTSGHSAHSLTVVSIFFKQRIIYSTIWEPTNKDNGKDELLPKYILLSPFFRVHGNSVKQIKSSLACEKSI